MVQHPASDTNITEIPRVFFGSKIIGSGRPCSMFPANVFILIFGAAVLKVHREAQHACRCIAPSKLEVDSS